MDAERIAAPRRIPTRRPSGEAVSIAKPVPGRSRAVSRLSDAFVRPPARGCDAAVAAAEGAARPFVEAFTRGGVRREITADEALAFVRGVTGTLSPGDTRSCYVATRAVSEWEEALRRGDSGPPLVVPGSAPAIRLVLAADMQVKGIAPLAFVLGPTADVCSRLEQEVRALLDSAVAEDARTHLARQC
jgi:hypothetical protein